MFYFQSSEELNLANLFTAKKICSAEEVSQSNYLERYLQAFSELKIEIPTLHEALAKARIALSPDYHDRLPQVKVDIRRVERGGAVITYRVHIGMFSMEVLMLNLAQPAHQSGRKFIAKGGFGEIIEVRVSETEQVIKRVAFRGEQVVLRYASDQMNWSLQANFAEIQNLLIEYAFNRICAALGIGPQIGVSGGFDIVCYQNAAQFYLEKCEPVHSQPVDKIQLRLLYCLRVMHTFKLIHKDIKPINIAYSPSLKDFVLLDFGVSAFVRESLGSKTETYREGTYQYMSPQMKKIYPGGVGSVDLYWNDLYALRKAVEYITSRTPTALPVQQNPQRKICFEDILVGHLHQLATESELTPHKTVEEVLKGNIPTVKMLETNGFPDVFVTNLSDRLKLLDLVQQNVEFLVRSIGLTNQLLLYLEKIMVKDIRTKKLIGKLSTDRYLLAHGEPIDRLNLRKLEKIYQRALRRVEEDLEESNQEHLEERGVWLLRIANCYMRDNAEHCLSFLKKYCNTNNKLPKRQLEVCRWLMEYLELDCLPPNSRKVFAPPLSEADEGLLIKCTILSSIHGKRELAEGLVLILVEATAQSESELQHLSQGDERNTVFGFVYSQLSKTNINDYKWLIYFEHATFLLSETGRHSYILEHYPSILQIEGLKEPGRAIALEAYAEALRITGQPVRSLEWYLQCLELKEKLHLAFDQGFLVTKQVVVRLYNQLKRYDEAVRLCSSVIRRLPNDEQNTILVVMFQQALVSSLIGLNSLSEANAVIGQTMKHLALVDRGNRSALNVLISQAQLVRVSKSRGNFQVFYQEAIRALKRRDRWKVAESLEKELMLCKVVAGLCTEFDQPVKSLEVLEMAITKVTNYIERRHETNNSTPLKQLLIGVEWLQIEEVSTRLRNEFQFFPKSVSVGAHYYVILLFKLHRVKAYTGVESLVNWVKTINAILQYIAAEPALGQMILGISRDISQRSEHCQLASQLLSTHQAASWLDCHYTKAQILFRMKRYGECISCIRTALDANTAERPARELEASMEQFLSEVYLELKEPGKVSECLIKARSLFRECHVQHPNDSYYQLNIAVCEMKLQRYREAVVWLEKIVKQEPPTDFQDQAVMKLATCLYRMRRFKKSLFSLLKQLACKAPTDEAYFYIALNSYQLRRWRHFRRYSLLLLINSADGECAGCLKQFLESKKDQLRLQVLFGQQQQPIQGQQHQMVVGLVLANLTKGKCLSRARLLGEKLKQA